MDRAPGWGLFDQIATRRSPYLFILYDALCGESLASPNTSCDEIHGYDLNDLYDQNFARIVCQAKRQFLGRL